MGQRDIQVVASGSSGNCVIVDSIMFDVGVPLKNIKQYLLNINYLLITHVHSDHINAGTLKHIVQNYPNITVMANREVAKKFPSLVHKVIGPNERMLIDDDILETFWAPHSVDCLGYVITYKDDERLLYCTDVYSMKHCPDYLFDYILLESNYNNTKLQAIQDSGYRQASNSLAHLSTQESKAFYYSHKRSIDSVYIELHKSERFY